MAKALAYSSVSVIDLTDVGVINFYLASNLPTSVIYDPNQNNGTYSPDWSSDNLIITPVISYNGTNLGLTSQGLVITFKRIEGSGTPTVLSEGESVVSGTLHVTANKMASVSSGQLTYICKVVYTDPDTGVPIETEAQLTYTLVTMASELKYAGIISSESAFLYNSERTIVGSTQITLTADITNCQVVQWQYKKSDGTFAAFPNTNNQSISGSTLIVKHDESAIWLNSRTAIIKLVTDDQSIYDIVQINKIYDGVAGNSTIAAVLTNENHVLPANADGSIKPENWDSAATQIYIYEGGNDITSQWDITVTPGTGLTGTYNSSTRRYTPSALTQDSSFADFVCTRTGYSTITKRYSITKQYAGADGADAVIYEVTSDVYAMNLNESGVFTPTSVTFSAYKKAGDALVKTNYSGRFIISESTDGTTYVNKYTSGSNENSKVYSPSSNKVATIRCILYASGGITQELDRQSVIITSDGVRGTDGTDGTDGLSMGLGNYADVIPCNTSGNASAARDLTIPFFAYKGITRVPVTATLGTLPTGVTLKNNTAGTASSDGRIVLTVANGATFGSSSLMTGDISISLSAESKTVEYKYTWTKNKQASNGTSAVLLQLYSEDGGTVEIGRNTTIKALMYSGTTVVNPTAVAWAKWENGSYTTISGETGANITITSDDVIDQMWLRCIATYGNKQYTAYYTVDDITDPLTAYTYATITEFKNNQGYGAVYTRIYRNGEEVDPIKSTTFSNVAPSAPSSGDFYYHLNPTAKTCVLKKYNGTEWINATETDDYHYSYYRIDNTGNSIDTTAPYKRNSRCIYVDPSIIQGRMQFICEVSDTAS